MDSLRSAAKIVAEVKRDRDQKRSATARRAVACPHPSYRPTTLGAGSAGAHHNRPRRRIPAEETDPPSTTDGALTGRRYATSKARLSVVRCWRGPVHSVHTP